jgi:signal transduction histidine kinase
LGNAVKFTFYGSIKVNLISRNQRLLTSVQDTGIGIN